MPTNVTPYNIPVPDNTDPVDVPADLTAMATAIGTALDGKVPLNSVAYFTEMRSGRYYGMQSIAGTTASQTLNEQRWFPFFVPNSVTADRIGAEVTTAGSAGSVLRLGIYEHDYTTDLPGALLLDAGTIDGTSATFQEITISQALTPGIYWFSSVAQVASLTARTGNIQMAPWLSPGTTSAATGSAPLRWPRTGATVTGALPNPAAPTNTVNSALVVQIRIA